MAKKRDYARGVGECVYCHRTLLVRTTGVAPAHNKPKCPGTGLPVLNRRGRPHLEARDE